LVQWHHTAELLLLHLLLLHLLLLHLLLLHLLLPLALWLHEYVTHQLRGHLVMQLWHHIAKLGHH